MATDPTAAAESAQSLAELNRWLSGLRAEQRMQEPLNREMLVLVGHADRQQAVAMAQTLGEQWQASGLFEKVQWNLQADLPARRRRPAGRRRTTGPATCWSRHRP